jgi:hypothetical protein
MPSDRIVDDHCWAHFYAGRVFLEGQTIVPPPGYQQWKYVVISKASDRRPSSFRHPTDEKDVIKQGGAQVYYWPENASSATARVVIYRLPVPGPSNLTSHSKSRG